MIVCLYFFFFKQKTAYEMRISDWSSDVCSSDLRELFALLIFEADTAFDHFIEAQRVFRLETIHHLRLKSRIDLAVTQNLNQFFGDEIGRASCRERVCQYVSISVVAVSLKKKINEQNSCVNDYSIIVQFHIII